MPTPTPSNIVRIDLTASQQKQVEAKTGQRADAIELTVAELEERITPRISFNHNEAFLSEA
jgi:hypothetical protein